MNIQEIRKQYPQYSDLSDDQLAQSLHAKFYSDMPYAEFSQKVGMAKPTENDKYLANPLVRLAKGWKDPIDALAQLAPRGVAAGLDVLGKANPVVRGVSALAQPWLAGEAQSLDKDIAASEAEYRAAQKRMGTGFDGMRLAGNVTSPANALPAKGLPAMSVAKPVQALKTGAVYGTAGSLMNPVTEGEFDPEKAKQVGIGTAASIVATPLVAKLAQVVVPRVAAIVSRQPNISPQEVEGAIQRALVDLKITPNQLAPEAMDGLRAQVSQALAKGEQINGPALVRKADFEAMGMQPTLGQITREPMQFAREQNLKGVEGVGDPLTARLKQQGDQLRESLGGLAGSADNRFDAGEKLVSALKGYDSARSAEVTKAYKGVRASTGVEADVPMSGLAQDSARILQDFQDSIPSAIRNRLASYGLFDGTQTKTFTQQNAEDLLKLINQHYDPRGPKAQQNALNQLRESVKQSMLEGGGDVYAAARGMARARFAEMDAIPAIKAAAEGTVAPDDFVRKFIVKGKVNDVVGLAGVLRQQSPEAYAEARAQIGAALKAAAYGADAVGDAPFRPKMFTAALNEIGVPKLRAFYSEAEIQQMQRISRVGGYMHQFPDRATVNTSGTSAALANLLQRVPVLGSPTVAIAKSAANAVERNAAVSKALDARVPVSRAPIPPSLQAEIDRLLGPASMGIGLLGAR